MNDITEFINTLDQFATTMTNVLPMIAMIAGIVGFLMVAYFAMRVVTK